MPAKGANLIGTEAPAKEPLSSKTAARSTAAGVELTSVSKRFRTKSGEVTALSALSLAVAPGEIVAIVGPSGCGKSTLLELVAGLDEPTGGRVAVGGGQAPALRLARCALMPQRDLLLPWRSVRDNAALALELRGVRRAQARRRAEALLERFGLTGFAEAAPAELSGGMRQRVAFVRTLLAEKPVLLLDEPFGSLDSLTRADMQEWLGRALEGEPRTVLLVSHDVEEALFVADRVAVLSPRPGRVVDEIAVSLPRPRARRPTVTSTEFVALRERALQVLG
jgi:ABC-type nitrate/sulfonate/bicarbonate transport system ATPase subunit